MSAPSRAALGARGRGAPEPTRPTAARPHAAAVRVAVWTVWALMLLVALGSIARWGRNVPLAEDWTLVAPLTGHEPSLTAWLWSQNNEHRVPLHRLVLLGLLKLTGGDFRAGMVANALVLAAVAAAMMRTAARLRGGWYRWTDLLFPVLFLHLGNWENLVWGWQLQFTLAAALTCTLLLVVLRDPGRVGTGTAAAAAGALLLFPLSGANGLIFALAMAPWALYAAWRGRRGALAAAVAVSVLLVGVYFVGYERPPWVPPNPGKHETVLTAAKFAAMALGSAVSTQFTAAILATALLLAPALLVLIVFAVEHWRAPGGERERPLGLLCFAGGTAVLTLAVGYGRAAYVPSIGLPSRYVLLAAPSLAAAYFIWELYGTAPLRRLMQTLLAATLVVLLPANTRAGFGWRDWYVGGMTAVERDLAAGVPRLELARRHHKFLLHWNEQLCASAMAWLRATGRGPFAKVRG